MKATGIYYEELRSTTNYSNKKVGIHLEIEEGETAKEALAKAKIFVQAALSSPEISGDLLENVVRSVKNAESAMQRFADSVQKSLPLDEEIPF